MERQGLFHIISWWTGEKHHQAAVEVLLASNTNISIITQYHRTSTAYRRTCKCIHKVLGRKIKA